MYVFFLIARAIPLIATNGLYGTQWKCSHCATATTSPTPIQSIMSKNKSQSQIAQCERTLSVSIVIAIYLKLWRKPDPFSRLLLTFLWKFTSVAVDP